MILKSAPRGDQASTIRIGGVPVREVPDGLLGCLKSGGEGEEVASPWRPREAASRRSRRHRPELAPQPPRVVVLQPLR